MTKHIQRITILGQRISLVRPVKPRMPIILKKELPQAKYNKRPKTNKENSGKVIAVCIKLKNGAIRALSTPATHLQVCEQMVTDIDNVVAVGWELENGHYLWR